MVDILLTRSWITIFQSVWYSSFVNIILRYDLITLRYTWPSFPRRLRKSLPDGIPVHEAKVEYSCSFKHVSICRGIHRVSRVHTMQNVRVLACRLTRFVNNRFHRISSYPIRDRVPCAIFQPHKLFLRIRPVYATHDWNLPESTKNDDLRCPLILHRSRRRWK